MYKLTKLSINGRFLRCTKISTREMKFPRILIATHEVTKVPK